MHILPLNLNVVVDDDGVAQRLELVRGDRVVKVRLGMVDPSIYGTVIRDAGLRKKGV
jgi:hypothetical protein